MLKNTRITTGSKVVLRDKKLADAVDDYVWRTDHKLAQLDATTPLTMTFPEYLSSYTSELHHPSLGRHSLAIETLDGKHIGNCMYYEVNEAKNEAELGILIGNRDYWDKGYGTDAVATLLSHIFHQSNLKRIYLKTLDWNNRAQKCFEKCRFTTHGHMVSDGYSFVLMEIHRRQWEEQQTDNLVRSMRTKGTNPN